MDLVSTGPMYISSKWVEVCLPLSVALMLYYNYWFTSLSDSLDSDRLVNGNHLLFTLTSLILNRGAYDSKP